MQHTSNLRGDTMKLQTVASYNLYREAAETTNRENRKAREMARKQERRAKFFDGMQFQAFQAAKASR
jgi:hypothetical protein